MKKLICCILVCTILLSMAACTEAQFESDDAVMAYMKGLWVRDNIYEDKTYYLFQNNAVFVINKEPFWRIANQAFDTYIAENQIEELCELEFQAIANDASIASFIMEAKREEFIVNAAKGMITFDKGQSGEEQIIVRPGEVVVNLVKEDDEVVLTKVSANSKTVEDVLEDLFKEIKSDVEIPVAKLVKSADLYAEYIRMLHPESYGWFLTDTSNDIMTYTQNGSLSDSGGSLTIADNELSFLKEDVVGGGKFTLLYDLEGVLGQSYHLFVNDSNYRSLENLLDHVTPLLEDIPGALSTAELLELFEKEHTTSESTRNLEKTVNSITYKIGQAVNGKSAVIYITLPEKVKLERITEEKNTEIQTPVTQPTETQATGSQNELGIPSAWEIQIKDNSGIIAVQYALLPGGKCCAIKNYVPYAMTGCTGSYTVEGNILSLFMNFNGGESYEVRYEVNTQAKTVTQLSNIGPVEGRGGGAGTVFSYEETYESAEDIAKTVAGL